MNLFCIHKWSKWSNPIGTSNGGKKQQWLLKNGLVEMERTDERTLSFREPNQ